MYGQGFPSLRQHDPDQVFRVHCHNTASQFQKQNTPRNAFNLTYLR